MLSPPESHAFLQTHHRKRPGRAAERGTGGSDAESSGKPCFPPDPPPPAPRTPGGSACGTLSPKRECGRGDAGAAGRGPAPCLPLRPASPPETLTSLAWSTRRAGHSPPGAMGHVARDRSAMGRRPIPRSGASSGPCGMRSIRRRARATSVTRPARRPAPIPPRAPAAVAHQIKSMARSASMVRPSEPRTHRQQGQPCHGCTASAPSGWR